MAEPNTPPKTRCPKCGTVQASTICSTCKTVKLRCHQCGGLCKETCVVTGLHPGTPRKTPPFSHDYRDRGDPLEKVDRFTPRPEYEDRGMFGSGW